MFEREISDADLRSVIEGGEVIEEYPDDSPHPSRLFSGAGSSCPLRVVAADNPEADETIVITVYEPDVELWDDEFKRRRP